MRHILLGSCIFTCAAACHRDAAAWGQGTPMNDVVTADTRFGLDLYARLRGPSGNLALAPSSIATALTMTYAGAHGTTADQMAQVLHVTSPPQSWHAGREALRRALVPPRGAPYQLHAADALWGQKGYAIQTDFLNLTRQYYGAGLRDVDFTSDPEGSRQTINDWVADQTKDKIRDLLPGGSITPLTRLVLTDALYFLGNWVHPFADSATFDEPFHQTANKTTPVKMMHQTTPFGLAEDDNVQVLELPYKGDDLAMVIVLPRKVDGLGAVEATLSVEKLAEWQRALKSQRVAVSLPRFRVEAASALVPALKALGMTAAFDDKQADFSGIGGQPHELCITDVRHKVYVDVNERGTEAAAATAVVVGLRSAARPAPTPVFRADHPFLFVIRHKQTGAVLFLGRVSEPQAASPG